MASEEWRVKSEKVKIGKYLTILADFGADNTNSLKNKAFGLVLLVVCKLLKTFQTAPNHLDSV